MNKELRAGRDSLETLWKQGLSGHALLERHTSLIDDALRNYFKKSQANPEGMSLIALGGYGREELFPYSDIDLMLLYDEQVEEQLNEVTEAIFYPLWDAGLEVGHGVRTLQSSIEEAEKDFFLQVSFLDARLLAGSQSLFDSLMQKFRTHFIEGKRKEFLQDMLSHRKKRHKRFGNHSFLLEPHIKESRGGFRDLQAMLWSSQVIFNLKNVKDLETAGLLTSAELATFEKAINDLIKIRNRLHYISGRKNDQLYFEHQEEMAQAFGYHDKQGMLGVELFMREVHEHLQTIAVTSDLFFEHVTEVLGLVATDKKPKELESGLILKHGRIHITNSELPTKRPHLLMRALAQVAKTGFPLHHRTKKLISTSLHLFDEKLRSSKLMSRAFFEIIQNKKDPLRALTDMLETGLLAAYIPEFKHLKSLAQHDIYHVFTVDRHLLQTVEEVNKLRQSEHALFITIETPSLLFLAALLHDIGKGSGKNHADYGAELATPIGERLGMNQADIKCLSFLIKNHLFLAEIALRRDLEDESLIGRCAKQVNDPDRLTMLYLLTIADTRATGPSAWSDWKAALLLELYLKTIHAIGTEDLFTPDPQHEVAWMREQISALFDDNPPVSLDILPDDYLLAFSPAEVTRHIRLHQELRTTESVIKPSKKSGHWSLLVMAHDKTGMLSKICGVLALHNLKVLSAQIYTWTDGTIVDVMHINSNIDSAFEEQNWLALEDDFDKAIHFKLGLTHRLHQKLRPIGSSTTQVNRCRAAKVIIDPQASDSYTVIEIYAADRAGLFYDITRTLSEFGINTFQAKISAEGDQVVDVFYVLDHQGSKIEDNFFQTEIKNGLLHAAT